MLLSVQSHCGKNMQNNDYHENNSECQQVHKHKWKWELVSRQHVHAWEKEVPPLARMFICDNVLPRSTYFIIFIQCKFTKLLNELFFSLPAR